MSHMQAIYILKHLPWILIVHLHTLAWRTGPSPQYPRWPDSNSGIQPLEPTSLDGGEPHMPLARRPCGKHVEFGTDIFLILLIIGRRSSILNLMWSIWMGCNYTSHEPGSVSAWPESKKLITTVCVSARKSLHSLTPCAEAERRHAAGQRARPCAFLRTRHKRRGVLGERRAWPPPARLSSAQLSSTRIASAYARAMCEETDSAMCVYLVPWRAKAKDGKLAPGSDEFRETFGGADHSLRGSGDVNHCESDRSVLPADVGSEHGVRCIL